MNKDLTIIADIGGNINNDLDLGKKLIDAAKEAGADDVKLQLYRKEDLYYHDYVNNNLDQNLKYDIAEKLIRHANDIGIGIFSSVFSIEGINFLRDNGITIFKLAAFEANRRDLWEHIIRCRPSKIVFSTGLLSDIEADLLFDFFDKHSLGDKVIPMHSISNYNLNASIRTEMIQYAAGSFCKATKYKMLNGELGFSDHFTSEFNLFSDFAFAFGCRIFEKHLKLDKWGTESFALTPNEFKAYTKGINCKQTIINSNETYQMYNYKNVVYIIRDIVKDEPLSLSTIGKFLCFRGVKENIDFSRVISPMEMMEYINNNKYVFNRNINKGEILTKDMISE